ncbi:MAG: hypothetical protein GY710_12005 [Desulfobacteraceae bacterium]|nr:hypothetical protein [Desulfobacteraceae bacterium]
MKKAHINRMKRIVQEAVDRSGIGEFILIAMLLPGHFMPLECISGAVLNHDYIKIVNPVMGCDSVVGAVVAEDRPGGRQEIFSIALADIAWIKQENKEKR